MSELPVPAGHAGSGETVPAGGPEEQCPVQRPAERPPQRPADRPHGSGSVGARAGRRTGTRAARLRDVVRLDLLALRSRPVAAGVVTAAMVGSVLLDWLWVTDASQYFHHVVLLVVGAVAVCLAWESDVRHRMAWLHGALPVGRRTVVDARYLAVATYLVVLVVCNAASGAQAATPGSGDGWLSDLVWDSVGSVALLSAAPPLVLMVRGEGSWVNGLLCLGVLGNGCFLPVVVASDVLGAWWPAARAPGTVSNSLVAASSLVLLCVSWLSTRCLYARQDH